MTNKVPQFRTFTGFRVVVLSHYYKWKFRNTCDDIFEITDSNGFSLNILYVKPLYYESQIGNYPPPNIELDEYWDFEILQVQKIVKK